MKTQRTPKKYLLGEPINYDGPSSVECAASYQKLLRDVFVQIGTDIPSQHANVMDKAITKFFDTFFVEVSKLNSGTSVKTFAETCKERQKDLLNLSNQLAVCDYSSVVDTLFVLCGSNGYTVPLKSIRYLPEGMKGIFSYLKEEDLLLDAFTLEKQPRFYIYLYRVLFELIITISELEIQFESNKDAVRQLYLLPSSMGQIFERLNPTQDVMEVYANELLDTLRSPSKDPSPAFRELFEKVRTDILNPKCRYRYVSDIKNAMRNKDFKAPFSSRDYYTTLKASTSSIEIDNRRRFYPSLVSSIFEADPLKGNPAVDQFDEFVGYHSYYRDSHDYPWNVIDDVIRTQMIPNPSKYKPRGIHNGSNAVQDRCNYVHHRLQPLLNSLSTDSMRDHNNGVEFLREVTRPSYRREMKNDVFVSDFSNATDTLNQEFQCWCLGIFFPDEVVEYWRFISQYPKVFHMPEGGMENYLQETGQPQGLLGSFDAFSLAHHILMLMLMKLSGLESHNPRSFYRILGDDSIVSYPHSCGDVYDNHSWLCSEVSLIKNDAKTGKSFFTDEGEYPEVILDFAKVSVYGGEFCSPLPFGLGSCYCKKPRITMLSPILWYSAHNVVFKSWLHHVIFSLYGSDTLALIAAESILLSGQISYLEPFKDLGLYEELDHVITGASIFSYGIAELQNTLFGFFVSDERKQESLYRKCSFEHLWAGLFPVDKMQEWSKWIPDGHKYWVLAEEAAAITDDIIDLYDLKDVELAKAIATLSVNTDVIDCIVNAVDRKATVIRDLQSDELFEDIAYLEYDEMFAHNKELAAMQVRSLRAKTSNQAGFLFNAIKEFKDVFSESSEIQVGIPDTVQKIVQFISTEVYHYTPEH